MAQSNVTLAVRYAAVDVVGSFLYFPIWWYGPGLVRTGAFCVGTLRSYARQFGIGIWLKNLLVPMYGQHDLAGRLISFFIRVAAVLYYAIVLAVLTALLLALFLGWLLFPVAVTYGLVSQGIGLLRSPI